MRKHVTKILFWCVVFLVSAFLAAGMQLAVGGQTQTEEKIAPGTPVPDHTFGISVAIEGTRAVITAPNWAGGTSAELAYVFEFDGTNWLETAQLGSFKPYISFGTSVALSGDRIIVGAQSETIQGKSYAGAAYMFERSPGGSWNQTTKLKATAPDVNQYFGASVAIDGDIAVAGALGADVNDMPGCTYVFKRDSLTSLWSLEQKLTASDGMADDFFGIVAIEGTTIVVGARGHNVDEGAVYIYEPDINNPGQWIETQKIPGDPTVGGEFGSAVDINGARIVVGAPYAYDTEGAAYVFYHDSRQGWIQEAKLVSDTADFFGASVAIDGDTVIVGDPSYDGVGTNSGAAYVFTRNGSTWTEDLKLVASDAAAEDNYGKSVALDNACAIVGAPHNEYNSGETGAAYIYCDLLNLLLVPQIYFEIICCVPVPPDPIGPVTYGIKYINPTGDDLTIRRWAHLTNPNGEITEVLPLGSISLSGFGRSKERQSFSLVRGDPAGEYLLTLFYDDGNLWSQSITFEKLSADQTILTTDELAPVRVTTGLGPNHPNPFNPTTTISYRISEPGPVMLRVYDIAGREVRTLVDERNHEAGEFAVTFDAAHVASGIYFYRLQAPGFSAMNKMILVK